MKFRSKPVEIEAIQWVGTNFEEISLFVWGKVYPEDSEFIWIDYRKFPLELHFGGKPGRGLDEFTDIHYVLLEGYWVAKNAVNLFVISDDDMKREYSKVE